MKTYRVQKVPNNLIEITGKSKSDLWDRAETISEFVSPWSTDAIAKINFKALYDDENFYFSFLVEDSDIYIDRSGDSVENIGNSDRVELFFRKNKDLDPYYCLEIDPSVRIMDFKAKPNKNFDFNWNWPKNDIFVKSDIQNNLFIVEGAISLKSLEEFGLIDNHKIETGVFRAKYNLNEKGSYEPTWISWVDPDTEEPNFHIESSFGVFELVDLL